MTDSICAPALGTPGDPPSRMPRRALRALMLLVAAIGAVAGLKVSAASASPFWPVQKLSLNAVRLLPWHAGDSLAGRRLLFGFGSPTTGRPPPPTLLVQNACPNSQLTRGVPLCVDRVDNRTRNAAREEELYQTWITHYALSEGQHLPPKRQSGNIQQPTLAPHLAECERGAHFRSLAEVWATNGSAPHWAQVKRTKGTGPPWVRSAESDNLLFTREAQAAIWRHQFPFDCANSDVKFLVATWAPPGVLSLPARIRKMAYTLSLALQHNRVLVYLPGSFAGADLPGCSASNSGGSFECFYAPITSDSCKAEAVRQMARIPVDADSSLEGSQALVVLKSEPTIAPLSDFWTWMVQPPAGTESSTVDELKPVNEWITSKLKEYGDAPDKINWLQAQSVRFMMRWPSAYLCHMANHARHIAYGQAVARQMAAAEKAQSLVTEMQEELRKAQNNSEQAGQQPLAAPLRGLLWRDGREEVWGVPYMPRPIVSVHVSKSQNASALQLDALAAHMWAAESLRLRYPDLRQVWLSADEQVVVQQSKCFRTWSFLSAHLSALSASSTRNATSPTSMEEAEALVNILLATQCDYFVGSPAADTVSLINELRATGGRLRAADKAVGAKPHPAS